MVIKHLCEKPQFRLYGCICAAVDPRHQPDRVDVQRRCPSPPPPAFGPAFASAPRSAMSVMRPAGDAVSDILPRERTADTTSRTMATDLPSSSSRPK